MSHRTIEINVKWFYGNIMQFTDDKSEVFDLSAKDNDVGNVGKEVMTDSEDRIRRNS